MDLMSVIALCVPAQPPQTVAALVLHESAGNPFAINVNGRYRLNRVPRSRAEATALLTELRTGQFGSYDIGLGQVNSVHLARFGLEPEALLDACTNLRVSMQILGECYERAGPGDAQRRLARALSCYNTGRMDRGFRNGYVAQVYRSAAASGTAVLPADSLHTLQHRLHPRANAH